MTNQELMSAMQQAGRLHIVSAGDAIPNIHRKTEPMEYEEIIGQALLTGDHETGIRRATCKLAASHRMFCGCGAVHDQKRVHVVEIIHPDKREETIAALCPECYGKNLPGIASVAKKATADYVAAGQEPPAVRVATWKQFIVIPGT